jgi:hypothetical protein
MDVHLPENARIRTRSTGCGCVCCGAVRSGATIVKAIVKVEIRYITYRSSGLLSF